MKIPVLSAGWENSRSTAEGRWARLGPYYAMFPIGFAQEAVERFTCIGDVVVDPFCGRGTAPYVAMVNGRSAVACDINPVAWVYAATKTSPAEDAASVKQRIDQIADTVLASDRKPDSEFQKLAFCRGVLGFINAARRELDWRDSSVDRTVAAFLIHYLHTKIPQGLSNQMRHSRAMSPAYCVRWWRKNGYKQPPEVNPVSFLSKRIDWRYGKGLPQRHRDTQVKVSLGDSAVDLPETGKPARLVITSPPYSGVTDYRADSWLRLWALGEGPALPVWSNNQKYANLDTYRDMLEAVFVATAARASSESIWLVRSDARQRTLDVATSTLAGIAGGRQIYTRAAPFEKATQTALYGDTAPKPGEVDLLLLPNSEPVPKGWQTSVKRAGLQQDQRIVASVAA